MNLGCDIVAVNRFKKWTPLWVERYFGISVYQQWIERNQSIDYLASRWAMKESIYKCCGIRENIVNDASGKPISKIEIIKGKINKVDVSYTFSIG
jgi:phosphopantetheine--protein transferase-like protein